MSDAQAHAAGHLLRRPALVLSCTGAATLLLWCLLTGSGSWHELLAGVGASALTVLFLTKVLRSESLQLRFRSRDLLQGWRIPWNLLAACWLITRLLLRDLSGRPLGSHYRECGFASARHDPVLVGRTVLAMLYTTVAPNFIVIGIDPEQSLMLFHQLQRTEVSGMTRALGAQR